MYLGLNISSSTHNCGCVHMVDDDNAMAAIWYYYYYYYYYFLTELSLERYKFVVQVVIGEQRGEGVK